MVQGNKHLCSNADSFLDLFLLPLQLVATAYVPPKVYIAELPFFLQNSKLSFEATMLILSFFNLSSVMYAQTFPSTKQRIWISLCVYDREDLSLMKM